MQLTIPDATAVSRIAHRLTGLEPLSDAEISAELVASTLFTGLDHWSFWTLICLYQHLQRQRWVGYVVETRLRGDLKQLGGMGSLGHPEEFPQSGTVPDEPDWKYYFHGRGCCLTNKVSGESIDVDFTDEGSSDRIDRFFYSNYLQDCRRLTFPETLLERSKPFQHWWQLEIYRLASAGCSNSEHAFELTDRGIALAESLSAIVDSFGRMMNDLDVFSARKIVFVALALGDPVLADRFSAQAQLPAEMRSAIQQKCFSAKEGRAGELLSLLNQDGKHSSDCLTALGEMGPEYSEAVVKAMCRRNPVDGLANRSVEILIDWNRSELGETLKSLLKQRYRERSGLSFFALKLLGKGESDDRFVRDYHITKLLLALFRRIPPESLEPEYVSMAATLLQACSGGVAGQAGLLLYLLEKEKGLRCLRTALSGRVPAAQSEAAAACVIINNDQSKEILVSALKRGDLRIQHVAASALSLFPTHDARTLAYDWFQRNGAVRKPQGQQMTFGDRTITTYDMDEVMQSETGLFFSHDLKELREAYSSFFSSRSSEFTAT